MMFPIIHNVFNNEVIWMDRGNNVLKVGDRIAYSNGVQVGWCEVVSIRVADNSVEKIEEMDEQEITVKVDKKVKKNWIFFLCPDIW